MYNIRKYDYVLKKWPSRLRVKEISLKLCNGQSTNKLPK